MDLSAPSADHIHTQQPVAQTISGGKKAFKAGECIVSTILLMMDGIALLLRFTFFLYKSRYMLYFRIIQRKYIFEGFISCNFHKAKCFLYLSRLFLYFVFVCNTSCKQPVAYLRSYKYSCQHQNRYRSTISDPCYKMCSGQLQIDQILLRRA